MKEQITVEWHNLEAGKYYKIIWKDDESNIQDDSNSCDLFNIYKLGFQPREWDIAEGKPPKKYNVYTFEYLTLFDSNPNISSQNINKRFVREIYEIPHDEILFEVIKIWFEKEHDINKPLLLSYVCPQNEAYYQLHFKSIHNWIIQMVGVMSMFFNKTWEILVSSSIKDAIMIEIPLLESSKVQINNNRKASPLSNT